MADSSVKPVILVRDDNIFSAGYVPPPSPHFDWKLDLGREDGYVTVFSDSFLHEAGRCRSAHRVAWLLEPPAIRPEIYDFVLDNRDLFDLVFSHVESFCDLDGRFAYCPFGTTWIREEDRLVHPKSRNVSTIVSRKDFAPGHLLRHRIVAAHARRMDVYGRAYRPIDEKLAGLADYRYSVTVENCRVDSYFTEKLLDCFMCGTVPVYWGFPKVGEIFDADGVIAFTELDELDPILDTLGPADYERRLPAIRRNLELAKPYTRLSEQLWQRGVGRFFEPGGMPRA